MCSLDWVCIFLTIHVESSWGTFLHLVSLLPRVGKMKGMMQTDLKSLSTRGLVYCLVGTQPTYYLESVFNLLSVNVSHKDKVWPWRQKLRLDSCLTVYAQST